MCEADGSRRRHHPLVEQGRVPQTPGDLEADPFRLIGLRLPLGLPRGGGRRPHAPPRHLRPPICTAWVYILTKDQSDAGHAGIFSRRTNRTQDARVYSHEGPIGRRTRGYILMKDQSDAGRAGIFSRRTNRTQDARVEKGDPGRGCQQGTRHRVEQPGGPTSRG
eukprot:1190304-Prorocentrum_minimum.AAC.4